MQEYYEFFGLTESATDEEINARYNELKAKYSEERWQDGEAGNKAARNLTKLDLAYKEIMSSRREKEQNTEGQSTLEEIASLLKDGKIAEAQTRLDECNERTAEWHYLQAVVFYKKNWTNDSKKQLEIAMEMEPENTKYRNAYGKMNAKNDYQQQTAGNTQNPYANSAPIDDDQMGGNACSNCLSCCYTYLCVDCLFSLCCGCR